MILRGDWLSTVSYCRDTGSAQYDTALSKSRKTRNINQNQKYYYNPLLSGPGSWTVPLNRIRKSHDSAQYDTFYRLLFSIKGNTKQSKNFKGALYVQTTNLLYDQLNSFVFHWCREQNNVKYAIFYTNHTNQLYTLNSIQLYKMLSRSVDHYLAELGTCHTYCDKLTSF